MNTSFSLLGVILADGLPSPPVVWIVSIKLGLQVNSKPLFKNQEVNPFAYSLPSERGQDHHYRRKLNQQYVTTLGFA